MPTPDADLPFFSPSENERWRAMRGWLLPAAARLLYRHASEANDDGAVVEVGSFAGKSAVCIGRGLRDGRKESKFTAIDVNFQPEFSANLGAFELADRVQTIRSPSLAAANNWREPIAFLYIDAHHGKAHACADFLAWESLLVPGGVVGLDDTAGPYIGPYLAVQAALRSGAYDLLPGAGGISFLRKKRPVLPDIGDFPMQPGSLVACVNCVSFWVGAMDPDLRLPVEPSPQPGPLIDRLLHVSPRSGARFLARRLRDLMRPVRGRPASPAVEATPKPSRENLLRNQGEEVGDPLGVLEWIEAVPDPGPEARATISYLRGCAEMQCGRPEAAIEVLRSLCDVVSPLLHYDVPIGQIASLRLAQAHDLGGNRGAAEAIYRDLANNAIAEIQKLAEAGLAGPFRLAEPSRDRLMREYVLDSPLYRYAKYQ